MSRKVCSAAAMILRGPPVAVVQSSGKNVVMQYRETALKYFARGRRHFQFRLQLTRSGQCLLLEGVLTDEPHKGTGLSEVLW